MASRKIYLVVLMDMSLSLMICFRDLKLATFVNIILIIPSKEEKHRYVTFFFKGQLNFLNSIYLALEYSISFSSKNTFCTMHVLFGNKL